MLWFQEFSTETINETSNRLATSMSGALRGEALEYPHIKIVRSSLWVVGALVEFCFWTERALTRDETEATCVSS